MSGLCLTVIVLERLDRNWLWYGRGGSCYELQIGGGGD